MSAITETAASSPASGHDRGSILIRTTRADDEEALLRLAQLDSHPPLDGTVLVAEVSGALRAARSLRTGETIADPFEHTEHLRGLLAARATSISPAPGPRRRVAVRLPRLYARAEAR